MTYKTILVLVIVFAATAAMSVSRARACSCMQMGVQESIDQATAVFEGQVLSVAPQNPNQEVGGGGLFRVSMRVARTWKGANQEDVTVHTQDSSAACGYNFQPNESYLVYASQGEDGALLVSLCSRTALIAEATEDLAVLGAGVTPVNPGSSAPPSGDRGATGHTRGATAAPPAESAGCQSCSVGAPVSAQRELAASAAFVLLSMLAMWRGSARTRERARRRERGCVRERA